MLSISQKRRRRGKDRFGKETQKLRRTLNNGCYTRQKGQNAMSKYVRVQCTECGVALRIKSDKLPEGHQADELFQNYCPACENEVFMKVSSLKQATKHVKESSNHVDRA